MTLVSTELELVPNVSDTKDKVGGASLRGGRGSTYARFAVLSLL